MTLKHQLSLFPEYKEILILKNKDLRSKFKNIEFNNVNLSYFRQEDKSLAKAHLIVFSNRKYLQNIKR
jgi:hypothetical protein